MINNGDNVTITGKTLGIKDVLTACGLKWNPTSKSWGGVVKCYNCMGERGGVEGFALTQLRNALKAGDVCLGSAPALAAAPARLPHWRQPNGELSWDC